MKNAELIPLINDGNESDYSRHAGVFDVQPHVGNV